VIDAVPLPGARMPETNLQICDPKRPTTCVLMGPGRHRWEFMLLPGETAEQVLEDDFIQSLVEPWDCGPVKLERKAVYRFHGLVAHRWRAGRVLLAGDAAHQTPPFAGQGMCSGVRDAVNLAWKLDAVLAGADEGLLDTYQQERDPHVRTLIAAAIGMGRVVCTQDPAAAAERDRAMLAQQAAGGTPLPPAAPAPFAEGCILPGSPAAGTLLPQPVRDGTRFDDLMGDGAWLVARTAPAAETPGLKVAALDRPEFAGFRPDLEAWLDKHGAEAALVRPDRYVFGTGAPGDLVRAWGRALRPAAVPA